MSEQADWSFPKSLQPDGDTLAFDLDAVLASVVTLQARVPENAYTAAGLGTDRLGNGVVIDDDGLILTIGYLITEANWIWLTTNDGRAVEAYPVAYDQATGFGLVRALGDLETPVLPRGTAASCSAGDDVYVISHGGLPHALTARLVDKREFAGYWEYVLDEALFTAPAHPEWGGAALVDAEGRLVGIGSLLVQEVVAGQSVQGNMIVPIDLLEPILDNLVTTGRSGAPPRPWLGMFTAESGSDLVVSGLSAVGPAAGAGLEAGDHVLEVAGAPVGTLAEMLRAIWAQGPVGVTVPLTVSRGGRTLQIDVESADRSDFLIKPLMH